MAGSPRSRCRATLGLDLRGHGASAVPSEAPPLTVERLVAEVVELLDRPGVARARVVGFSAGGHVGQRPTIEHPARAIGSASRSTARRRSTRRARPKQRFSG
jgi:pimeloyl-ACP methyl ester carboxylesterase